MLLYTEKWLALLTKGATLLNSKDATSAPFALGLMSTRLALGWKGSGRAGFRPGSWLGIALLPGSGVYSTSGISAPGLGSFGRPNTGALKSKALTRSPAT